MPLCGFLLKKLLAAAPLAFVLTLLPCAAAFAQSTCPSGANDSHTSIAVNYDPSAFSSSLPDCERCGADGDASRSPAEAELALPEAPAAGAASGGNPEHYDVNPAAVWNQPPFSRIGIGADVSPLGIGLKTAIVLDRYFDARFMGNFFIYNSQSFEIEGFRTNVNLNLASASASLDWYPFNSVWRLSPGLMFFNGNQLSVAANIVPGTSFTLSNQTFYSATPNAATGATPLTGTGVLGLNTRRPAATLTGGFAKFIPRSNRHWSFPAEFGVAFTGAPSANVNVSGWACLDAAQTQCANLSDATNPVTVEFNNALQSSLSKWRKDLGVVQVYPLFSYAVVYSFNIR